MAPTDAENIEAAIAANTDQLNAEDLVGSPLTGQIKRIKTTRARKKGDQPVQVFLDSWQHPWKPCKTMVRLLVELWGKDPRSWVGQSVTLYAQDGVRDPTGGTTIGVRVSHASIPHQRTVHLTETRGRKRAWQVRPLDIAPPNLAAVLEGHGWTVAKLDEARKAKGKGTIASLTDTQRQQLAVRYQDRAVLDRDTTKTEG